MIPDYNHNGRVDAGDFYIHEEIINNNYLDCMPAPRIGRRSRLNLSTKRYNNDNYEHPQLWNSLLVMIGLVGMLGCVVGFIVFIYLPISTRTWSGYLIFGYVLCSVGFGIFYVFFKLSYDEYISIATKDDRRKEAAKRRLNEIEEKAKNGPYVGMPTCYINKTCLGPYTKVDRSVDMETVTFYTNPTTRRNYPIDLYYWYKDDKLIFSAKATFTIAVNEVHDYRTEDLLDVEKG